MWQVIGQDSVVSLLQHALETNSISHAYLLAGPPHIGKMTLSINLAQALSCPAASPPCSECASCQRIASGNHADVQVISIGKLNGSTETRSRAEIGIDQVKELLHSASLPPFEGRYKVFIIDGAEMMSTEAANCLLKTLEEPPGKVVFLLLTVNESLLPETVVSRCQRLELRPMGILALESALKERWAIEPQRARLLARLSHGCPGWAISGVLDEGLISQRDLGIEKLLKVLDSGYEERLAYSSQLAALFGDSREQVYSLLALWLDYCRDILLIRTGCGNIITNVDRLTELDWFAQSYSLQQIEAFINAIKAASVQLRLNAGPRLVFDVLMLDLPMKGDESGTKPAGR